MENNQNNENNENNENNQNNTIKENTQKVQDLVTNIKSSKKAQIILAVILIAVFVPLFVVLKLNIGSSSHSSKPTPELLKSKVLPVLQKECSNANRIKNQTKVECLNADVGTDDLSIKLMYKALNGGEKLNSVDPKLVKKQICSKAKMAQLLRQIDYFEFTYVNEDESDKIVVKIEDCK